MRTRGIAIAALAAALGASSLALAAPVNVPNGGFEEGSFANWERFERGGGDWGIYGVAPRGLGPLLPLPPEGKNAALLSQEAPGVNILHRVLTLKRNAVNKIKFQLFYDNNVQQFFTPHTFRFRGDRRNQQLRVDLMKPNAKIKSLRDKDILATLAWTKQGDAPRRGYRPVKANMKKLDIDARRVRLRIAEVDNQGGFSVGVDALRQSARDLD